MAEFTDEEALRELYKQSGTDSVQARDLMTAGGYDPEAVTAGSAATLASTDPDLADQSDTFDVVVESAGMNAWLETQFNVKPGDSQVLDAVRSGLQNAAKINEAQQMLRSSVARNTTASFSRIGNIIESVVGASEPLWHRPQQATFGMLTGKPKDEIKSIILPEIWDGETEEPTAFQSSLKQLRDLFMASMAGNSEKFWQIADQEPTVLESMSNDAEFQDIVIHQAFNGDEEAYGDWLFDQTKSVAGQANIVALSGVYSVGEVFVDPLMVFEFAPAVFTRTAAKTAARRLAKAREKAARHPSDKNLRAVVKVESEIEARRTFPDVVNIQSNAENQLAKAKATMEANPGDVESMRRFVQAEKRMAEANLAVDMHKQKVTDIIPDGADTIVRRMPRRNPDTIKTRGRTVEDVRRQVLANEIKPQAAVLKDLADNGFGGLNRTQKDLEAAVKAVREKGLEARADIETLNRYGRLSDATKRHLEMIGVGRDLIIRKEALKSKSLLTDDFTEFDGPLFSQRSVLGPDDGEVTGDAMKLLMEGADPADVTVYGAVMPEYQMLGHGDPRPRFVDGRFVRFIEDSRKVEVVDPKSGKIKRVFRDSDQLNLFSNRVEPGLLPGSKLLNPAEVVGRGVWPLREPMHALRGTQIFPRWQAGTGDYMTQTQATTEWIAGLARVTGMGGLNRFGQLRLSRKGKAASDKVFDQLDRTYVDGSGKLHKMDTEEFAKRMDSLTNEERDMYFGLRQWLDHMADRQGLQGDMNLSDYAPHYFSKDQFRGGARPIEYVGLPATGEITATHLLPRRDVPGYGRDLFVVMENYNRAAHRKIIMEPTYQDMLTMARESDDAAIVAYTDDFVKEAKGLPTPVDQQVDRILQATAVRTKDIPGLGMLTRKFSEWGSVRSALTVSSLFYANLLAGNPNYLLQNLGTGALNVVSKYGILNTARAALQMATPEGQKLARKSGVDKQWIKVYENEGVNRLNEIMSNLGPSQSEFWNRGLALHAAISDVTRRTGKSMKELREEGLLAATLAEGVKAAEFTQFVYGVGGRSPMLSRLMGKSAITTGTQFLSFPFKQTEFLFALGKENPGYVMRYFAYSGMMQRLAAEGEIDASQFTGIGPQLDFLKPRRGRPMPLSPGMEALASLLDISEAAGNEDLSAMELATEKFQKTLEALIPGAKIVERVSRMARELSTGEVRVSRTGEFIRPKKFPEETLPTVLQTRSREDRLQDQFDRQFRQRRNDRLFKQRQLTRAAIKAIETGDSEQLADLQGQLAAEGIFISGQAVNRQYELRHLSRRLRVLMQNPEFMPPDLLGRPDFITGEDVSQ